MISTEYEVKALDAIRWRSFGPRLWATVRRSDTGWDVIDVYEDRELAEAWVAYTNRRAL